MVAYSYKARFISKIEELSKQQTMRNERARHARPGEEVQHYYAMRTKQCRLVGRSICTAVTPVRIDFSVDRVKIAGRPVIKGIAALNAFAVRDGFNDWDDLLEFWRVEHGIKVAPGYARYLPKAWSGVLIEWRDFKP